MISQKTDYDIWCAYDEIAKGEKLICDMEKSLKDGEDPDLRDAFGRRRNLQLGVPSGERSHRLFDVAPELAVAVIRAHVASKKSLLEALSALANTELNNTQL